MKKYLKLFIVILLGSMFMACDATARSILEEIPNKNKEEWAKENGADWVIYWYLCGSDLESNYGAATNDLAEMMEVQLPEGVQIVIQTGGTHMWQNDIIDANYSERYLYDSEGLQLIEQHDIANMGDAEVLTSFLEFAETNYPGKRTMVHFWNHGGGSLTGAAFDEVFEGDSLTLDELYTSFAEVYGEIPEGYPVDIVGFDTCLMATIDTAYTLCDFSNYLVASEESEPGNGWDYTGWLSAIAENKTIHPEDLGKVICDTYTKGCEQFGTHEEITLSVTDLSQIGPVLEAYETFGLEALDYAVNLDTSIFNHMAKEAVSVENYGGNTREKGFSNMVDLGQLARSMAEYTPESAQAVCEALDGAVVYQIKSTYRPDGMGLACYYPYDGNIENLERFMNVSPSTSFAFYYLYGLTGYFDEEGMAYLNERLGYTQEEVPELENLETMGSDWEDMPLTINDEGCATLTLGPEAYEALSQVTFELYYTSFEEDDGALIALGTDNNMTGDWDTGVFSENFLGYWGHIDGVPCYMEMVYEGEDYNEYAVPVLINDEVYNLSIIYDYLEEGYTILGARKPLDESGAADKNIYTLQEGDQLEPIHYVNDLNSESDALVPFTMDAITVTEDTTFDDAYLGDGYYLMMFAMHDAQGNTMYSAVATFEAIDGEIYTSVD